MSFDMPRQLYVELGYSCRRQNMLPQHLLPGQNMPSTSLSWAKDANGNLQPTIIVTICVYEQD